MELSRFALCVFFVMISIKDCYNRGYGKVSQRRRLSCSFQDPSPLRKITLNDASGRVWYLVALKPPKRTGVFAVNSTISTDDTLRLFFGKSTAIKTSRNGDDPGICKANILEFTEIPNNKGFTFIGIVTEKEEELRLMYLSKEFLITRSCLEKNAYGVCKNDIYGLYRTTPNPYIPKRSIRRLDAALLRSTCSLTVSNDFVRAVNRKACPDIRLPRHDGKCQ